MGDLQPKKRSRLRRFLRAFFYTMLSLFVLGVVSFIILERTGKLGDAVELFRKITGEPGTRFVAWAEEIYFEARYDISVWWSGDETEAQPANKNAKALIVGASAQLPPMPRAKEIAEPSSSNPVSQPTPPPVDPFVPPQGEIPWTQYIHSDGTPSGIYTAQIFPNNHLPNEPVYLAWIDPRGFNFHWVPGSEEPIAPEQDPEGLSRSGHIPKQDHKEVVAAFNGGYLTKHGAFGAKFNDLVVIPARYGLATAAIRKDGSLTIGEWGRDFTAKDKDIITYRQNLRLTVDQGQVVEDIRWRTWGGSRLSASRPSDPLAGDLKAHTWRSGIGMTQSGAIIFAAGDFLDGELLAESLQAAGAWRAMQLDVNSSYYCIFVFFEQNAQGGVEEFVLGPKMTPPNGKFIRLPNKKDFAYLTRKTGSGQ